MSRCESLLSDRSSCHKIRWDLYRYLGVEEVKVWDAAQQGQQTEVCTQHDEQKQHVTIITSPRYTDLQRHCFWMTRGTLNRSLSVRCSRCRAALDAMLCWFCCRLSNQGTHKLCHNKEQCISCLRQQPLIHPRMVGLKFMNSTIH